MCQCTVIFLRVYENDCLLYLEMDSVISNRVQYSLHSFQVLEIPLTILSPLS